MIALGLMSGTSMDGIDAAIIETDGKFAIQSITEGSIRYNKAFHHCLKAAEYSVRKYKGNQSHISKEFSRDLLEYLDKFKIKPDEICTYFGGHLPSFHEIVDHSTDLHIKLAQDLIKDSTIEIVGYHGQNLYHNPALGITMQFGDGQKMADVLGVEVVNNFRAADVQNGGQGAPFAPLYHQALATRDNLSSIAIVNCGGIANISLITGPDPSDLMGFDTGPGNCLVDFYVKQISCGKETYDRDGKYGSKGRVSQRLLDRLYDDLSWYLEKAPPKSLDIGDIKFPHDITGIPVENVIRTLEEFTARTIVDAIKFSEIFPETWVLAGGGWKNPIILASLKEQLSVKIPGANIVLAEEMGFSNDGLEAEIFAYLAVRSKLGLPLSYPSTTGVNRPCKGGLLHEPQFKEKVGYKSR